MGHGCECRDREADIRPLTVREAHGIYLAHLRYDFPPSERKPWLMIRRAWAEERYFAYALYDGDAVAAYAFFCSGEDGGAVLLDYFAVVRGRRDRGLGGLFLRELESALIPRRCPMILLEAEDPARGADGADRALRERRIAFYLGSGALDTGLRYCVYGVSFVVMGLGVRTTGEDLQRTAEAQCVRLYRQMLGERRFGAHFRMEAPGLPSGDGRKREWISH